MRQSKFRWYSIWSQVGFALIFFLINFVENYPYYPVFESFIYSLIYTALVVGVAAINYFYLLPMFIKGKRWSYFSLLLVVMTIFISLYYFIETILPSSYEEQEADTKHEILDLAYDYLILSITTAYTSLFYFVEQWYRNLTIETQLRNEKLQTELNFLKSQINPHFLFNTLNNIYSYAQTGNDKTAPMLVRLSSILRFMVYDCSENRVGLSKEIIAVEDLLEIHKMKNSEQQNIELFVDGVKSYHLVVPLIIVNFVENACKHSDVVNNPNGFIKVLLTVDSADICRLSIRNTFKEKAFIAEEYSGLGLENIKKRLELQYANNYQLMEEKANGVYELQLVIPVERKQ